MFFVRRSVHSAVVAERDHLARILERYHLSEVEYLRAQVAGLSDHLARIGRREVGLPENPTPAREHMPPPTPPPATFEKMVADFDDDFTRNDLRMRATKMLRDGMKWPTIERTIRSEFGLELEDAGT